MFFGKKRDVVDLTDMRKRGLLKDAIPETNEEGMIDFRKQESKSSSSQSSGYTDFSSPSNPNSNSIPDMDFLGSLAGASNTAVSNSGSSITDNLREARQRNLGNSEVNELKIKIEDNEFKIRSLQEKIIELERKLGERHL